VLRRIALLPAAAALLVILAGAAHAERVWVKDEVRINVRSGPGVKFRILGGLKTGDSVELISRGDGWTQVRGPEDLSGWIPEGYLQTETPARVRLESHEADTAELRQRVTTLSAEVEELRALNQEISAQETAGVSELQRLTRENLELRAGARWPEWIAGASILFIGMILGIFVHRSTTRRPGPRIRL
jgi:uncharacterized protein YgiM (DUF1202 family)